MQIKLDKLIIENFKGIKSFELNLAGESATIIGKNGTGKTTVADAFYWLITDQNSDRRANFTIIHLDSGRDDAAIVQGNLWFGSKLVKLKKIHRQKWKIQKGKTESEFQGFTTDHFYNDEPVTKSKYAKRLNRLVNAKYFRNLSDVSYFCCQTTIAERRKILFKIAAGGIDENQLYTLYEKFEPIKGKDHGAHKKALEMAQRDADAQLKSIPSRIDELKEMLPDTEGDEIELRNKLNRIDTRIIEIKNNAANIDRIKKASEIQAHLIAIENDVRASANEKAKNKIKDRSDLSFALEDKRNSINNIERSIKETEAKLNTAIKSRLDIYDEYEKTISMKFEKSKFCFACGQELPADRIKSQEDEFNLNRSRLLKDIEAEGIVLKEDIDGFKRILIDLKTKSGAHISDMKLIERHIETIKKEIADIENETEHELSERQKPLKAQLEALSAPQDMSEELNDLEAEKSKINSLILNYTQVEKIERKIELHRKNQKKFAEEYERIESELALIKEFETIKAEHIEKSISGAFKITEWKLFELLQNGNMRDICEPQYKGIDFNLDLNTGARINVGIDCINTLSKHFYIYCPIFIDNSESVTEWIGCTNQTIKLRAVEDAEALTFIIDK